MATKKKATRTAKVARPKVAGSARGAAKKTAKKRSPQNIAIFALVAALVFMSIGFAAYSTTLNIGGTNDITVKKAVWDIHWDPSYGTSGMTETTGANYVDIENPIVGDTSVTFSATLEKPGDIAEFKVRAKNFGTFDANLTKITMSSLSEPYLTYVVNYAGTDYTQTTDNLAIALDPTDTAVVTITVTYVAPQNESQLPSSDTTVTVTAAFDYDQD